MGGGYSEDVPFYTYSILLATRRRSSSRLPKTETYTNMATTQTGKMLSSLQYALYLLFLCAPGISSSTLRLHQDQHYMLPQDSGFYTINANKELVHGVVAAAPKLRRAVRSAREDGVASGAYQQHRHRRSATESAVPKVYGQVMQRISGLQLVY